MTPNHIDRYEVRGEIGRGGMATVLKGYDPRFKRDVAIKLLPREFLHDPQFRARFQREAQTIAALEHPAIVPVYDFGDADGQLYLVMRLMTGGSLAERLEKGPLSIVETARIFERLAPALDSAHALGIIHRDLKPANILFDQWNNPYLSDFGIAKLVAGSSTALTATGGLVGTPAYMSPEQVRGVDELDGRSDIYAMGVILFQMLTGQLPYKANTPIGLAFMHVTEPVPDILAVNASLPYAYQSVIDKAMAKDREDRPMTTTAFSDTISDLASRVTAVPESKDTIVEPLPEPQSPEELLEEPPPQLQEPETTQSEVPTIPKPLPTSLEIEPLPKEREADAPDPESEAVLPALPEPVALPQSTTEPGRSRRLPIWSWAVIGVIVIITLVGLNALLGGQNGDERGETVTGTVPTTNPVTPTTNAVSSASDSTRTPTPSTVSGTTFTGDDCQDALGCVIYGPDDPILLASALVISGPNAQLGLDSLYGVEIAIDERGELLGHAIELQSEDDGCSRDGGENVAQKIVANPQVVAMIGTSCSSAAVPAAEIISDAGYVMVSPSNTAPALTDPEIHEAGYLRTSHNDKIQGQVMAEYAINVLGVAKAAAIHDGDPYTEGLATVFIEAFRALGGELIAVEPIDPNADDVIPALSAIATAGPPEFLYYPVFISLGAVITRQAQEVPELDGVILAAADGIQSPSFIDAAGKAAEGMYSSGPDLSFANEDYEHFLQMYQEKVGSEPIAPFHAHAFDATWMVLDAIEKVAQVADDGSMLIGRQALRDALFATSGMIGLTGTITCDVNGDCADSRIAISRVENDEFVSAPLVSPPVSDATRTDTPTPQPTAVPLATPLATTEPATPLPQSCPLNPLANAYAAGPSGEKSVQISWSPVPGASHYWPSVLGEGPEGNCCYTLVLDGSVSVESTTYTIDWWGIDNNQYTFGTNFRGRISARDSNNNEICSASFEFDR